MVGPPVRGAELAPAIVGIFLVMRLQVREKVELERYARMPRRHDAVGDELAVGRRTEVAVDAHPRTPPPTPRPDAPPPAPPPPPRYSSIFCPPPERVGILLDPFPPSRWAGLKKL